MVNKFFDIFGRGGGRGGGGSSGGPFRPAAGQLVSVLADDGRGYGVVKLLAVDEGGVHARLYAQRFEARPRAEGDLAGLTLAGAGPGHEGNPFSIGHVPLSHRSFAAWRPALICQRPVTEDELDGYRMWREAKAGYF